MITHQDFYPIVRTDGDGYNPPLVLTTTGADKSVVMPFYFLEELSIDWQSNMNTMTDQCGKTEVHRQGGSNWMMNVKGYVPKSQLHKLKRLATDEKAYTANSALHSMDCVVKDMTVDQISDENQLEWVNTNGDQKSEQAFGFHMQLQNPKATNNSA